MKQIYDNKDIGETIDKSFDAGIKEGYRRCREQMMKEAVEGEVMDFCFVREVNYSSAKIEFTKIPNLEIGDKVRVIVLKAEEE